MKRFASGLSIAVILGYWLYSFGAYFLRTGEAARPTSVTWLALYVCVKTAVVLAVVWPLLRASGERLADLGFGPRDLRLALPRGVLLAVALFFVINGLVGSLLNAAGLGGGTSPAVAALFRDPREAGSTPLKREVAGTREGR